MSSKVKFSWLQFFKDAGIPPKEAAKYSLQFDDNRMKPDMLPELTKDLLNDLGITLIGDKLAILRHGRDVQRQYERGNVSLASLTTEVATTKKGAAVQSRSASQSLVGFRRERNEIALASSAMETAQTEARSVQAVPASRPRVAMAAAGDLQRVKRKQKTSQALGMAKVPVVPPSVSQPTKFSISRTIPAEEDSEDDEPVRRVVAQPVAAAVPRARPVVVQKVAQRTLAVENIEDDESATRSVVSVAAAPPKVNVNLSTLIHGLRSPSTSSSGAEPIITRVVPLRDDSVAPRTSRSTAVNTVSSSLHRSSIAASSRLTRSDETEGRQVAYAYSRPSSADPPAAKRPIVSLAEFPAAKKSAVKSRLGSLPVSPDPEVRSSASWNGEAGRLSNRPKQRSSVFQRLGGSV